MVKKIQNPLKHIENIAKANETDRRHEDMNLKNSLRKIKYNSKKYDIRFINYKNIWQKCS